VNIINFFEPDEALMKTKFFAPQSTAVLIAGTAMLFSAAVFAQEDEQDVSERWKFSLGVGVVNQAKYPGSSKEKTTAFPIFSANYGRYFIGALPVAGIPAGVGMSFYRDQNWNVGAGVGYDFAKPREESDSASLRGMGDIDRTALGSFFASYTQDWLKVTGAVVTDLGGKGQGVRVLLDLQGRYRVSDRLMLTAGPALVWANSKYTQTFFGVTAVQSASSGLPQYSASSGLNSAAFAIGASYQLTPQWGIGARLSANRLRGDAVNSPITEKKNRNTFGVFSNYRF
jgi:outer membrane protein